MGNTASAAKILPLSPSSLSSSSAPLILVVDDREENLEAMQALFGDDENWQLRCTSSGEEALRCLLKDDVSLVLLDVQMPEMDGYEVAELIRANPKTRYMPIIFISAIARTHEAMMDGYQRGAIDFILKPFDPLILRQKIHNLLGYESNRRALLQLNQQLEHERAFNDSILSNAAEGIVVVDEDGIIQYANPVMSRMLTCYEKMLKGVSFLSLFPSDHEAEHEKISSHSNNEQIKWKLSPFYRAWQKGQVYRLYEADMKRFNGETLPVALSCAPLPRPQKAMVMLIRDITTEQELRQKLESLIVTDPLTGLLNRRGFYQAASAALARAKRDERLLAVLYLDLDGFKKINDSLGHDTGDDLLRHIADEIKTCLRPYDPLARMGGDEFTILLDGLKSCEDASQAADKLLRKIARPHQVGEETLTVTASIGIACYPESGTDAETLLRAADMAMYEVKKNGRQHYRHHSPQMSERAIAKLEIEQRLRLAVEEKHFTLAYQPQIWMDTGKLRGFEALLRWSQDKVMEEKVSELSPDEFIGHLEETRLIQPLWQWILSEALARLIDFQNLYGDEVVLSLNVSPVQFAQENMVDDLERCLQEKGISAKLLELEVTEGMLLQDLDMTRTHLQHLRELGLSVAVDDFGTGYSSLAYLRQFDVDVLKIDRLFIANMLSSPRDAAVVSTIIDLSKHLGLKVVAEGVETQEQCQWLAQHHCCIMQGYLVSPALPFEAACQIPPQVDWLQPQYSFIS